MWLSFNLDRVVIMAVSEDVSEEVRKYRFLHAATTQLIMNRMIGCILNNRVIYKKNGQNTAQSKF